jgi:hypothetical protein
MTEIPRSAPVRSRLRAILFGLLLIGSAGGAFVLGVMVHKYRVQIRGKLSSHAIRRDPGSTNLYNVSVQKVSVPAEGRDGGIAALAGRRPAREPEGSELGSWTRTGPCTRLAVAVPVNVAGTASTIRRRPV